MTAASQMKANGMIHIVLPVYNAFDDLRDCMASLLAHTNEAPVVVIDDASTDPRISPFLATVARENPGRMTILSNDVNLGFVQTVNRGMTYTQGDVVLLNSDTLVTPHWLERIAACAASHTDIGTVTPFSNNAEICSYPVFCRNTRVEGLDLTPLGQAMADVHDAISNTTLTPPA